MADGGVEGGGLEGVELGVRVEEAHVGDVLRGGASTGDVEHRGGQVDTDDTAVCGEPGGVEGALANRFDM